MAAAAEAATRDPEAEMLASTEETGYEWELYKENVRPLKRGRNVSLLNRSLRSHTDGAIKKSLFETRRKLIEEIDKYEGDDPLRPWLECIKWVQESFPSGGESSGLVLIYEQCVRTFWHDERYRDDLRYLNVWIEYADCCSDAEVIYRFLEANKIGESHSLFYSSYALHMESKNKVKRADEIFNLGIARRAKPLGKLEAAYRKFLIQSAKKISPEEESTDILPQARSFGTCISNIERRPLAENVNFATNMVNQPRMGNSRSVSVYKELKSAASGNSEDLKSIDGAWSTLGPLSDRNKENSCAPAKWRSYKVPQRVVGRTAIPSTSIEVFVDEECARLPPAEVKRTTIPSVLKQFDGDIEKHKRETQLLRENPLCKFPKSAMR